MATIGALMVFHVAGKRQVTRSTVTVGNDLCLGIQGSCVTISSGLPLLFLLS